MVPLECALALKSIQISHGSIWAQRRYQTLGSRPHMRLLQPSSLMPSDPIVPHGSLSSISPLAELTRSIPPAQGLTPSPPELMRVFPLKLMDGVLSSGTGHPGPGAGHQNGLLMVLPNVSLLDGSQKHLLTFRLLATSAKCDNILDSWPEPLLSRFGSVVLTQRWYRPEIRIWSFLLEF